LLKVPVGQRPPDVPVRAIRPPRRTLDPVTTDQLGGTRKRAHNPDRAFFIVVGVALLILAALYPVARLVDAHDDGKRPLYDNIAQMAWLQYLYYQQRDEAYPVEVSSGQSVTIGDQTYTVNPGVVLVVTATDGGWCITGHDDVGNEAGDFCYDGDVNPGDPF
jgi:hypothetical protein